MLLSLMRNFLVDASDPDWMNNERMQLVVKECIQRVVDSSLRLNTAINNPILNLVFTELCSDTKSEEFLRYLYRDLFLNRFPLEKLDVKPELPTKSEPLL